MKTPKNLSIQISVSKKGNYICRLHCCNLLDTFQLLCDEPRRYLAATMVVRDGSTCLVVLVPCRAYQLERNWTQDGHGTRFREGQF